ncbi:MAG: (E)-4-hydroxy-3-methylbut-2-enyl-diphosphate synthase, partial [Bacteroidales bacterium]|nr:(E)-4-hydroxy-3-methylbut-2-enyl-diphosphate synthase [Bacteroidales bacterium]
MKHLVKVGNVVIGSGRIVVQTMCNTHTDDIEGTVAQTLRLAEAGAELVRITVPGLADVPHIAEIRRRVREAGCDVPLVADIHFSAETAIACASVVEKVRINPGNFHNDHDKARAKFTEFLSVCKEHGTAVRIGLNHGSLGAFITEKFGNTPRAMAEAAMEWIRMAVEHDFYNVVVSLKASNTVVMVEAYRLLQKAMEDYGHVFPLHVGVTEAGNGDSGRIKSCVGIASVLSAGIGDTVRVSLTEDPEAEIPVARYLAQRYSRTTVDQISPRASLDRNDKVPYGRNDSAVIPSPVGASVSPPCSSRQTFLLRAACDWGP